MELWRVRPKNINVVKEIRFEFPLIFIRLKYFSRTFFYFAFNLFIHIFMTLPDLNVLITFSWIHDKRIAYGYDCTKSHFYMLICDDDEERMRETVTKKTQCERECKSYWVVSWFLTGFPVSLSILVCSSSAFMFFTCCFSLSLQLLKILLLWRTIAIERMAQHKNFMRFAMNSPAESNIIR